MEVGDYQLCSACLYAEGSPSELGFIVSTKACGQYGFGASLDIAGRLQSCGWLTAGSLMVE